jgi:hypothetical protein
VTEGEAHIKTVTRRVLVHTGYVYWYQVAVRAFLLSPPSLETIFGRLGQKRKEEKKMC